MKLVIFGLTISSSWGNGHATLWRGLCRALAARGHHVIFYEKDTPYYAGTRDQFELPDGELVLYSDWAEMRDRAARDIASADVSMVTSFCPDGIDATNAVLGASRAIRCFYDLDTPVTLASLEKGRKLSYVGAGGLADFDFVFSFTGGAAMQALRSRLGARRVHALYGHVDPTIYRPVTPAESYRSDLSYLGTYSSDRQQMLERLFVQPAKCLSQQRFLIGGAQYPDSFPWVPNIFFVRHLPPQEHPAFFCSSRLTLNVTRRPMAVMGWCPSGRLFEATACGTPVISDNWQGLDTFFQPREEIIVGSNAADTISAIELSDAELRRIGRNARERTLSEHTSELRAQQLLDVLGSGPTTAPSELPANGVAIGA